MARKRREKRRDILEALVKFFLALVVTLVVLVLLGLTVYGGFLGVRAFIGVWPEVRDWIAGAAAAVWNFIKLAGSVILVIIFLVGLCGGF